MVTLKNYNNFNLLKTYQLSYQYFLKVIFIKLLKKFYPSYFYFKEGHQFNFIFNKLYLEFIAANNINLYPTYNIFSENIFVILPIVKTNLNIPTGHEYINLLLTKLPVLTSKNTFVVNNIEKYFTQSFILRHSVHFTQYKKKNNFYSAVTFLLNHNLKLIIEISPFNEITCFIDDINMNILTLFTLLGISFKYLLMVHPIFKSILLNNMQLYLKELNDLNESNSENFENYNDIISIIKYSLLVTTSSTDIVNKGQVKRSNNIIINKNKADTKYWILEDFLSFILLLIYYKNNYFYFNVRDTLKFKKLYNFGSFIQKKFSQSVRKCFFTTDYYLENTIEALDEKQLNDPKQNYFQKLNKFSYSAMKYFALNLNEELSTNPSCAALMKSNDLTELNDLFKISLVNLETTRISHLSNFELRDIQLSQAGYLCIINTLESIKSGLLLQLASNTFVDKFNVLYTTLYKLSDTGNNTLYKNSQYSANTIFKISTLPLTKLNKNNTIYSMKAVYRKLFTTVSSEYNVMYMPFSNIFSYLTLFIPFANYSDPTRMLMACKMLTQAKPLVYKEKAHIITNYEKNTSTHNCYNILSNTEGIVSYVDTNFIIIRDFYNRDIYYFNPQNNYNSNNYLYTPNVWVGDKILIGQILYNNSTTVNNEFTLGKNIFIGLNYFFGLEYEDAMVLNKNIQTDYSFLSLNLTFIDSILKFSNTRHDFTTKYPFDEKKYYYNKYKNITKFGIISANEFIGPHTVIFNKITVRTNNLFKILNILFLYSYAINSKHITSVKKNSLLFVENLKNSDIFSSELQNILLDKLYPVVLYNNYDDNVTRRKPSTRFGDFLYNFMLFLFKYSNTNFYSNNIWNIISKHVTLKKEEYGRIINTYLNVYEDKTTLQLSDIKKKISNLDTLSQIDINKSVSKINEFVEIMNKPVIKYINPHFIKNSEKSLDFLYYMVHKNLN